MGPVVHLTIFQKLEILDYFHSPICAGNLTKATNWVASDRKFGRPLFSRTSMRRIVHKEAEIRAAGGTKRLTKMVSLGRTGAFPEMEFELDRWIDLTRRAGIPVQFWMLAMQGKKILRKVTPAQFDGDVCRFKFSKGWAYAFMTRFALSRRKMTHRSKVNPNSDTNLKTIAAFHMDTRILQRSASNDPLYGLAPPWAVFNRDQVPIELLGESATTIDNRGARHVWVGVGDEADAKRFCSLDLMIPMEVLADLSNLPKPHIVFRASAFKAGSDWTGLTASGELERDCWHVGVIVSFQKCAWVDTATNVYGMKQLAELRDHLISLGAKIAVKFEDNQSAHKTEFAIASMALHLSSWIQILYPPNLTHCLQPVDRHIGIQYKRAVYDAVRSELLRRMEAGITVGLSACEKRILITRAIGETHARLAAKGFQRAFVGTGSWLATDGSQDGDVQLQNVDSYDYKVACSEANLTAHADLRAEEARAKEVQQQAAAAAAAAAEAQLRVAEEAELKHQLDLCQASVQIGEPLWAESLREQVTALTKVGFEAIASHLKASFIVAGSYLTHEICAALRTSPIFAETLTSAPVYNDIDVYHGRFEADVPLARVPGGCTYLQLPFSDVDVNLIECSAISLAAITADLDVNMTGCCVRVDVAGNGEVGGLKWFIAPQFWRFLFGEMTIRPIHRRSAARTFVRMAYKRMQHGFPMKLDGLDPGQGRIFDSHKAKMEV